MKKIIIGITALVIILLALFIFKKNSQQSAVLGEDVDLIRVGMLNKKTDFGFVRIPLLREDNNLKNLNVAVDLNGDLKFSAYNTGEGIQSEWLVQNMPVKYIEGKNAFSFFFPDKTVDDKIPEGGISLKAVLTKDFINIADWDGTVPNEAETLEIKITKITFEDTGNLQSPAKGLDGNFGFIYHDGFPFVNLAMAQSADDMKGKGVFNSDVPDINQKTNECAPTSAANSLIWLAKKFKFEDKLPGQAELIEELKTDMTWNNGIQPGKFIIGKNKITSDRKLPLINHQIGNFDGTNTFKQMYEELKKGQDVEMRIQYKNEDGTPNSGHWVTAVGVETLTNGTELIDVHDPLSVGARTLDIYRLEATANGIQIVNYPYGRAYVSFAIAESYVVPSPTPSLTQTPVTITESPAIEASATATPETTKESSDKPVASMTFSHVKPGEYSEIYLSVKTSPNASVSAKLVGPGVSSPADMSAVADSSGMAKLTWKIVSFGSYQVTGTAGGKSFSANTVVK